MLPSTVTYHKKWIENTKSLWDECMKLPFEVKQVVVYGKVCNQTRKTCAVGKAYSYSGLDLPSIPIPQELCGIIDRIEKEFGERPNTILCNLYEDGSHHISPHSDDETMLLGGSSIFSLSLGSTRHFDIVHKFSGEKVRLDLYDGDLLVMKNGTQSMYKHSVPKELKVKLPRINLTFRSVKN